MQGLGGLRAVTLEGLGFRVWVGSGRSPEIGEFLLLVCTFLLCSYSSVYSCHVYSHLGLATGVRESLDPKPETLLEWRVRRIYGACMDCRKSMEAS